ncbi:MAG: (4Fe-4S)-binding protein [Bacteroidia bacterium]
MSEEIKKYSNGEITIVWQPANCIHSKLCWKNLRGVFDPVKRPWINANGAATEKIIEQVNKCPSGALSYYRNNDELKEEQTIAAESIIEVSPGGPLLVYGNIAIKDANGNKIRKNKVTAFCRCGASANKPYCDGSHVNNGFIG